MTGDVTRETYAKLSELFSSYKAEWLKEAVFDLFTEPNYFPQLKKENPCVLIGGRGTGKTTALLSLSYEGQHKLMGSPDKFLGEIPFIGLYHRVNTNRVTAFDGPEVSRERWVRIFSHWLNLLFVSSILDFLLWCDGQWEGTGSLAPAELNKLATALNMNNVPTSTREMADAIELDVLRFEARVNNIADDDADLALSMRGRPVDLLVSALRTMPAFANKPVFFLIDEYENLSDYQQQVVNTLIKHSSDHGYTFKIGVRELGFRQRTTLNEGEQLVDPADYVRIDIAASLSSRFSEFARQICNDRLRRALQSERKPEALDIAELFPRLAPEAEAELLGVQDRLAELESEERGRLSADPWIQTLSPLERYVLLTAGRGTAADRAQRFAAAPKKWKVHYENYKYASLFGLRRGRRGIRKYYTGWDTYALISGSNIRYLLQLVDTALLMHLEEGSSGEVAIAPKHQTEAAQKVGSKNLRELEGLSRHGAKLARLALSLGRVFQVMAEQSAGHAPEVNQFNVPPDSDGCDVGVIDRATETIHAAVMHLALVRYPGSKLQDSTEIRDYDYALHPIFAPLFSISHRRKRKIPLSYSEINLLIERPPVAIERLLKRQQRDVSRELPDQLKLFSEFYTDDDTEADLYARN
jgi:hypothetical protein